MTILFYAPKSGQWLEALQSCIKGVVPKKEIDIIRTARGLSRRLSRPGFDLDVIVLIIPTKNEFKNILSFRHLLLDRRIILILPDSDDNTIRHAHSLFPRFIDYVDGNKSDVSAVLQKMLNYIFEQKKRLIQQWASPVAKRNGTKSAMPGSEPEPC